MFNWLKSLFSPPKPSGPPQILKSFSTSDPTISKEGVTIEGDSWVINSEEPQTILLFEVPDPEIEHCILTYRAELKTHNFDGKAYLEMWCRLPGKGEFFSKGLQQALKGTTEWASRETPFFLKKGQRPDLIKLNIVAQGKGQVSARSIELLQTPLE